MNKTIKEQVYGLTFTDFEMHLDEVLELEMGEEEKVELWDLITRKLDASPAYEALDEDIRFYLEGAK